MPIYDIVCQDCRYAGEVLAATTTAPLACPSCGGGNVVKEMSATSSLTGKSPQAIPGPGDTACCGHAPGTAEGCAGPGSCCGRGPGG